MESKKNKEIGICDKKNKQKKTTNHGKYKRQHPHHLHSQFSTQNHMIIKHTTHARRGKVSLNFHNLREERRGIEEGRGGGEGNKGDGVPDFGEVLELFDEF